MVRPSDEDIHCGHFQMEQLSVFDGQRQFRLELVRGMSLTDQPEPRDPPRTTEKIQPENNFDSVAFVACEAVAVAASVHPVATYYDSFVKSMTHSYD